MVLLQGLIAASPGAMALAATGSLELSEKVANATAKEMRIAGINWAYVSVNTPHQRYDVQAFRAAQLQPGSGCEFRSSQPGHRSASHLKAFGFTAHISFA